MVKTLDNPRNLPYVAVKIEGQTHWIWFDVKNTKVKDFNFIGTEGWGKGGACTSIEVPKDLIIGIQYSESLQYGN